jgi:RNA polymerase sigma-70 factor (ECF subfamily)
MTPTDGDSVRPAPPRETIPLALATAMWHLPPRQRAVLVLRDTLGWPSGDVAELLDATPDSAEPASDEEQG